MSFNEVIEDFVSLGRRKYATKTIEIYYHHLKKFSQYIGEKQIEQMNLMDDVLKFIRHMERKGYADTTINLAMTALKQCWKHLFNLEKQYDVEIPFKHEAIPIKGNVDSNSHRPVSEKQYRKMMNQIQLSTSVSEHKKKRDLTIFALLFCSGLRISELTSLDLNSLNLERRTGKVITRKRKDQEKYREFYWTFEADLILKSYLNLRNELNTSSSALFVNQKQLKRLTTRSIQRFMQTYAEKAEIKNVKLTPHGFRHGVGERAAKNQMYPPLLQKLLGHKHPGNTQIYYNLHNEDLLREYHSKIGDGRLFERRNEPQYSRRI